MAITRVKAKGRRESGPFIPLPISVMEHPNFIHMSGKAIKLLLDMCTQLRFKKNEGAINNGDISAAMEIMKTRGWNSNEGLTYAVRELLHYGFIIITRRGDRKRCHLYAVTWWAINECNGKLDSGMATTAPTNNWKQCKQKWQRPKRKPKS